jgi:hypothetical protein
VNAHLTQARRDDSERRRRRVLTALERLHADGRALTVAGVAKAVGAHRSFLYRHPDLHTAVLQRAAEPPPTGKGGHTVSRRSLLTDLANLQHRNTRMAAHIAQLERRLSETLGTAAWQESGLSAPAGIDVLQRRITDLENQVLDLRQQLADHTDELAAARAANRELMAHLNRVQT